MPDTNQLSKYLKPEHVKDGDVINFMDAGIIAPKTFTKNGKTETNDVLEMTVEVNGHKKTYTPNSQSLKFLNEAWTTKTEKWVGRQAKVTIGLANNGNKIILAKPVLSETELPETVG